ncbi:TPA: AAA family ATPase [Morganella morganii]
MNNLSIKFLKVTIQNFRGIPDELVVPLDAPLTVIHAANGTGKSTVGYALEWLITGKVDDLSKTELECQWGTGRTSVSAECLIGDKYHVLTRHKSSLSITNKDGKKEKITDENLLKMLTPSSISGKSAIALNKAKRGWLRNSRWLYSNSLALLVDNNKADERQQIFADILGFGHLTSTLRDLRDYRKALPNTKGLEDKITGVKTEIDALQSSISISFPAKEEALRDIDSIFKALPPTVGGTLAERLAEAQLRVKSLSQKRQRELVVLNTLYEKWEQYHSSLKQITALRQKVDGLVLEQNQSREEQVVRASELFAAQQKVSDAQRSLKWVDDSLQTIQGWQSVTTTDGVKEYFQGGELSQAELTDKFVELKWSSEQQEKWKESTVFLEANFQTIIELERQKKDLTANPINPAIDYDEKVRGAEAAKNARVRAEAEFDAFSNVLGKLKAMGSEIVHSHDNTHCPLCNYNWGTIDKLQLEISSNMDILSPALDSATSALTKARQKEQEAINALALSTSQKSAYEAYLNRVTSVSQELQNFEKKTDYFETMGVQDFSGMNLSDLAHLNRRVTSAIQLSRIFTKLAEVEQFFAIIPKHGVSTRVSNAVEHFDSYKKYFQKQLDQHEPERIRLEPVVQGLVEAVNSKSKEIASINTSIAAAVEGTSIFDSHWRELFGQQPVLAESYELKRQQLDQQGSELSKYNSMLDKCAAVVSVDADSAKLKNLELELAGLTRKLKIGKDYITSAEHAIEKYSLQVKDFTASSLRPLLSPATELFSRMHANEVYKGLGVSAGDDALKWTVFAEGFESALDAEGKLSQGQRQDLALSLYLARARNTGGSFFLDEPIAHLDDLNRVAMLDIFRLAATSMPSMNLILTTASDSLARHMAQKFSSIKDRHLLNMIYLEGNPRTGVKMTVNGNAELSN